MTNPRCGSPRPAGATTSSRPTLFTPRTVSLRHPRPRSCPWPRSSSAQGRQVQLDAPDRCCPPGLDFLLVVVTGLLVLGNGVVAGGIHQIHTSQVTVASSGLLRVRVSHLTIEVYKYDCQCPANLQNFPDFLTGPVVGTTSDEYTCRVALQSHGRERNEQRSEPFPTSSRRSARESR